MTTKLKTIRLHPEVIKKIEELATKENRNFNNMVETILIEYFKKERSNDVIKPEFPEDRNS